MEDMEKALGLGEDFKLENGKTIQVFPCRLTELKNAAKLYQAYATFNIPGLYMTGNEEALKAFEDLLLLATNQGDLRDKQEERAGAVEKILEKFGTIADGGSEVRRFIQRFLGFVPRDTGAEKSDEQ